MAPHDLLCKWCSTFVGQKKNFCSIFCESRYTRSKRRKLPFKKPASFSEQSRSAEYDYPRTSKSSPRRKEQFLEEVITAMDAEMGDRDRIRRNDNNAVSTKKEPESKNNVSKEKQPKEEDKKTVVPKLKLSPKDGEKDRPELLKSKTQTLLTKSKGKIPIISPTSDIVVSRQTNKPRKESEPPNVEQSKVKPKLSKSKTLVPQGTIVDKSDASQDSLLPLLPKQKSQLAIGLEKKVQSSGYGAPVNPRLRPSALKTNSANFLSKPKRQTSASSSKSSNNIQTVPGLLSEDVKDTKGSKADKSGSNIPATINEETSRTLPKERSSVRSRQSRSSDGGTASSTPADATSKPKEKHEMNTKQKQHPPPQRQQQLQHQFVTPSETGRTELEKINELIREETSASVFIDNSLLQSRLSSIKRKVEVRKRGRDSRSSTGSDTEAFMGSMNDITTEREAGLDLTSLQQKPRPPLTSTRSTARANVTHISHELNDPLTAK